MVPIEGLGGVPEPKPDRSARIRENEVREAPRADRAREDGDGVVISSEAQAAATLTRALRMAEEQPDIRSDRVEAAREHIARGDYKRRDVVSRVAQRINKYLP